MAFLYKTDGTKTIVFPENGKDFQLKELYKLLDVDMIEVINLRNGIILVCDEEGKLHNEPKFNVYATAAYQIHFGAVDEIYGNALLCKSEELK